MIGKINPKDITCQFEGYTNKESTKKILENDLKNGDKYFHNGNITTLDEEDYIFSEDLVGAMF